MTDLVRPTLGFIRDDAAKKSGHFEVDHLRGLGRRQAVAEGKRFPLESEQIYEFFWKKQALILAIVLL